MKYFTFNNINSYDNLGIIIKKMPFDFRPEKNIDTFEVNGKNGSIHIDNNTYKGISITIECVIYDITKINLIKKTLQGVGKITFDNVKEYVATIKNQISFEKYLTFLSEFPLQLELQPFATDITSTIINKTASSTFEVEGDVETYPLITVTGIGIITLNNKSIQVTESDIVIDCELMNCTKNSVNKNDKVILDEFPILIIGENNLTIGAGITNVKIEYKKRWY